MRQQRLHYGAGGMDVRLGLSVRLAAVGAVVAAEAVD
jgi:hypothetical protein